MGAGKLQRLYALLWKLVAETASAPQVEGGMGGEERMETIEMLSAHVRAHAAIQRPAGFVRMS